MTATWPKWATVRADAVRTVLPPDEWGPWANGGSCSRGIPGVFGFEDSQHPSEPPYFFHCRSCIVGVQKGGVVPKPHPRRDLGLCVRCGEPAELDRNVVRGDPVACQIAESRGITVARLSTRKWCETCDPYSRPWCGSRSCTTSRKHRAEPTGCCYKTRVGNLGPHCEEACEQLANKGMTSQKARYARRRAAGQCVSCGGQPRPDRASCERCARRGAGYRRSQS